MSSTLGNISFYKQGNGITNSNVTKVKTDDTMVSYFIVIRNPGVVLKQRSNGDSLVFGLYYVTHPDQIHNFIAGSAKNFLF